jgi:hypothetical protein
MRADIWRFCSSSSGDYSSAYITLQTEDKDLEGAGMTFTIGRGNEIVRCRPAYADARLVQLELISAPVG